MIDEFGLYVQADGSNGDSAHRTGLAMALEALNGNQTRAEEIYESALRYFEIAPGIFIRHPPENPKDWAGLPSNFSRDQASRLILGFAILGKKDPIKRWLGQMARRFFFHQNNINPVSAKRRPRDIMAPGEWRNVIRGLSLWWAYPALLVLDLFFIGDIYTRSKWDGASLYVPDLKFALKKYSTPAAWLANKLNDRTPWLAEALHNHSPDKNGCIELQELFRTLSKK